ncbi:MAG: class I tRNA ligase family protein [Candidatus Eremiobacteraeota bacterium]|nr:class I tRNA ligase family protein [Candidatus Eremiobacteraeota bacterium]
MRYDAAAVEAKWQARWAEERCFAADAVPDGEPFFNFDGGPFPNGPLHMGHVRTFTLGDVMARYQRMRGRRVLYCFEFDAFGLPNELAAEALGVTPEELTQANILRMQRQMVRLGLSYDWEHVPATCEPRYYRWTQWLFLALRERGLVYRAAADLNWCPSCSTTLAHMQVEDGRCWRCESAVETRTLTQWYVAISRYSAILAEGLDELSGFSDRVRNVLRGFLGATSGIEVELAPADASGLALRAFVADELANAAPAYAAVAPGHPVLAALLPDASGELAEWSRPAGRARRRTGGRADDALDGFDTGLRVRLPDRTTVIPVFVARYAEQGFATGIELGVPAKSPRDRAFAERHGLAWRGGDAAPLRGRRATHYHVHDWLVSRQRAWGTPIPIVHCTACGEVPVPEDRLPVRVPSRPPNGEPGGLAAVPGFAETVCPRCDAPARRETDTLDCYFDVVWCFLGCAARLDDGFRFSAADFAPWMPVDWFHNGLDSFFYMHLYRFIGRVLYEMGILAEPEPIRRYAGHDAVLLAGRKMSKHHGNTVAPDEIVERVGADVLRLQILGAANPLKSVEWSASGVERAQRFLADAWSLVCRVAEDVRDGDGPLRAAGDERRLPLEDAVDQSVRRITAFVERYQYAGCIRELQSLLRRLRAGLERLERRPDDERLRAALVASARRFVQVLAPFAPHAAEEMWERLGGDGLVAVAPWPGVLPAFGAAA